MRQEIGKTYFVVIDPFWDPAFRKTVAKFSFDTLVRAFAGQGDREWIVFRNSIVSATLGSLPQIRARSLAVSTLMMR